METTGILILTLYLLLMATVQSAPASSFQSIKMTAALVPSAHLRMRGSYSSQHDRLKRMTSPPYLYHEPTFHPRKRRQGQIGMSTMSPQNSVLSTMAKKHYPWRQRNSPNRAATHLHSHSTEKSPALEDAREETIEMDYPLSRMENGFNLTNDNTKIDDADKGITSDSASTSLELWGMPAQSIIILNLVAVIWGTQHAVIKSVVDDDTTIGLGAGFIKWMENAGIHLSSVPDSVTNDGGSAAGGSSAAYFTLARFGLAALLASPYTPGLRLFVHDIKDKLGVESTTSVRSLDEDGGNLRQSQHDASESNSREVSSSVATNDTYNDPMEDREDREAIKLAWKYGAELGLYMFLGYAFQAIGLETTTASRSGFLLYLNVKFVPFFSYFIFGKRIKRSTWISALVAFGGTALLAFDNANASGSTTNGLNTAFNVGDLWSIAAAAASAMFILRMEAASKAVPNSSELNAANLWTVAVLSLLWTMGLSWNGIQDSVDTAAFVVTMQQTLQQTLSTIIRHPLALIYLSGVTTALANFLQSKAQKDVSAERASVIYAMDPVYGAIFANILLGETLGELGLVGALLIVVAAATNAVMDFGSVGDEDAVTMSSGKEKR